jgi:predicted dithiol-disulfide oxidoreductase (DUF899 family)
VHLFSVRATYDKEADLNKAVLTQAIFQESFRQERDAWIKTRAELLAKKKAIEERYRLLVDERRNLEIRLVNVIYNYLITYKY